MATRARMHQTTVRFTPELWALLQAAASAGGVSAAQYVRDATLARLSFVAGERQARATPGDDRDPRAERARAGAEVVQAGAAAVTAQAQLARDRSRELRAQVKRGR